MRKLRLWGRTMAPELFCTVLGKAEAEGKFRRLIPFENVGTKHRFTPIHSEHPCLKPYLQKKIISLYTALDATPPCKDATKGTVIVQIGEQLWFPFWRRSCSHSGTFRAKVCPLWPHMAE